MKDFSDDACVYTIGYGGKSAQEFFERLAEASVERLIDVRLYNTSQLAGFTKRDDLAYLTQAILGGEYRHVPQLAPTKDILTDYKKGLIDWPQYETTFNRLMAARHIEQTLDRRQLTNACLLCAEANPKQCHRRLVAEYLAKYWKGIVIVHL